MKFKWRNVLFLAGIFLLIVLLMDFSRRLDELDRLSKQLAVVQQQATSVMNTQVALMTQVAYSSSDQAVEEWAYEEGKWVRPGETLVEIAPAANVTPTPVPLLPTEETVPNWRIWWELFFGEKP